MSGLPRLLTRTLAKRHPNNGDRQVFYTGLGLGSLLATNASWSQHNHFGPNIIILVGQY